MDRWEHHRACEYVVGDETYNWHPTSMSEWDFEINEVIDNHGDDRGVLHFLKLRYDDPLYDLYEIDPSYREALSYLRVVSPTFFEALLEFEAPHIADVLDLLAHGVGVGRDGVTWASAIESWNELRAAMTHLDRALRGSWEFLLESRLPPSAIKYVPKVRGWKRPLSPSSDIGSDQATSSTDTSDVAEPPTDLDQRDRRQGYQRWSREELLSFRSSHSFFTPLPWTSPRFEIGPEPRDVDPDLGFVVEDYEE